MTKVEISSVYGPVRSWRLGASLGIDLLCVDSICSFECVYCQLGKINQVTSQRDTFVTLEKLQRDLENSDWKSADVITFSGSGEPTLAANLGDAIDLVRKITSKPIIILTNSTLLTDDKVCEEISRADRVFCKLDSWNEDSLTRVDRPAESIDFETIVTGLKKLRSAYNGFLAIQTMLLREPSDADLLEYSNVVKNLEPDEIQLNSPSRPIPQEYFTETRGNEVIANDSFRTLKVVPKARLEVIAKRLTDLTGINVTSR